MKLYLRRHNYKYAAEQMLLTLFPDERPEYPEQPLPAGENGAVLTLSLGRRWATATALLQWDGGRYTAACRCPASRAAGDELERDRALQYILKQAFYKAGVQALGREPPWGSLTGVRPVKLPTRALERGLSPQAAERELRRKYRVSPERARLAMAAAQAGLAAKRSLKPDELSLYLGIPFCPTRCAYCSFVSADVQRALKLVEPFLDALEREICGVGSLMSQAGTAARTVYMGGGTPTTLSAEQLDRVLTCLRRAVDLSRCTEFTVEAGRPDTITADKLAVLQRHGVGRLSVNPQSLRDEVLAAMGRAHTAADVFRAYELVRASGRWGVNMDLIAGLPRDTLDGFRYTLDAVLDLAPENVTVHTLALKKGSFLLTGGEGRTSLPDGRTVSAMLSYAWARLAGAGYAPYYLYRQKYMTGSLENVGWCRPGFESLYNICIMEELHTVLALGGGGSTKLTDPNTGKVQRMTNPKYPYDYINAIDRIISEKAALIPFYRDCQKRLRLF